ncbi:hypothetical protein RHMOL_Rhmol11G0080600 [Rhododendron molle]|uniref:Uncharacterized protein n=3 Tax=Rhododendron molle TaxID=49168 RepID=A0ACC0LQS8_RHOML|nr:hypothetical protein RHMOL_Rhmol11G0080600 [Rhododendron molle]KAI8530709.1 hypothetical protein RHMOL_Rhmol11G0080600 [Rhododendron molle]KAI8530710.1 hypothetical protein RHMOL_Rhmol11G0080600 [Rhododendron molle]
MLASSNSVLVALDFDFKVFIFCIKSWRKCAFGQIATSFGFAHSSKCKTGGVLFLEIPLLFPLGSLS